MMVGQLRVSVLNTEQFGSSHARHGSRRRQNTPGRHSVFFCSSGVPHPVWNSAQSWSTNRLMLAFSRCTASWSLADSPSSASCSCQVATNVRAVVTVASQMPVLMNLKLVRMPAASAAHAATPPGRFSSVPVKSWRVCAA